MRSNWWWAACWLWLGAVAANAETTNTAGQDFIFTVIEENDRFVIPQSDRHYTQGLHFQLLWPDAEMPATHRPLSWLPDFGLTNGVKYGVGTGQSIFTPLRTETKVLQKDDRPYAGWLYASFIRQNRGLGPGGLPTLDHFELNLGVVGPYSQADNTQIWFHGLIRVNEPNGWRHQIKNEPALLLFWQRSMRFADIPLAGHWRWQWLGTGEMRLGNVETSAGAGIETRLGRNIPDEFAVSFPVAWGWYLFGGVGGRLVGYNIFLDGNTYTDSHKVDKDSAVMRARGGLMFTLRRVELGYVYNFVLREFKKQEDSDYYGSLICRYRF